MVWNGTSVNTALKLSLRRRLRMFRVMYERLV